MTDLVSSSDKEKLPELRRHAINALRKAAGWAVAEGMTFTQFLHEAENAFYHAQEERPHV